jgi:hypothetical protein
MTRLERALAYAAAGLLGEVVQTAVKSVHRDRNWRLTGTTYLWMAPIYGSAAWLFEPAHDALRQRPVWERAAAWTVGIYAVEAASGEAIRAITGEVPWDYARPRGQRTSAPINVRGLIRPAYAPLWALTGLALERLHDRLVPNRR